MNLEHNYVSRTKKNAFKSFFLIHAAERFNGKEVDIIARSYDHQ